MCRQTIGQRKAGYMVYLSRGLAQAAHGPNSAGDGSTVPLIEDHKEFVVVHNDKKTVDVGTQTEPSAKQKRKLEKRKAAAKAQQQADKPRVNFFGAPVQLPPGAWADLTDEEFPVTE